MKIMFSTCATGIAFFIFWAISLHNAELYSSLTNESRGVELLTAIFYIIAGIILLKQGYDLAKSGKINAAIFIFLLGLFFIFVGGEEESWGQWILGLSTPENLKSINAQEEINIHNLKIFSGLMSPHFILNMFVVLYCITIPIFEELFKPIQKFLHKISFPSIPLFYTPIFILALVYEKAMWIIGAGETWRHTEITEFFFACGFLAFSLTSMLRLNSQVQHFTQK